MNAAEVNSIAGINNGNTIGNSKIGKSPLLTEATEEIAEINVPALEIPHRPRNIVINNIKGSLTAQSNRIINIGNRNIITKINDSNE